VLPLNKNSYCVVDKGKAGHFVQKSAVDLAEISGEVVEIFYKSDMSIARRLTMFGARIMRARAKKVHEELTKNPSKKLGGCGIISPSFKLRRSNDCRF